MESNKTNDNHNHNHNHNGNSNGNSNGNARPASASASMVTTPREAFSFGPAGHATSFFGLAAEPTRQTFHQQQQPPQPSTPSMPSAAATPQAPAWNASLPTTPPYVPQFSATTSLILSRMKRDRDFSSALSDASAALSRPDKIVFEDAKSRLVQQMNTMSSTMPAPQPSSQIRQPSLEDIVQKGTKRKRPGQGGRDGDEAEKKKAVDFTQSTLILPIQSVPQSTAYAPGTSTTSASAGGMCVKCGLSSSFPSNVLIICIRCNTVCHQGCFPSSSTVPGTGNSPTDICPQCIMAAEGHIQNQALPPHLQPDDDLRRKQKIERIRQTRLATLPEGIRPAKPELVGFGPGAASDRARTEYFSNMRKTDALNLLSFCDQLRPQLLVDVLVSISKRHPDLPMFDSPDWDKTTPRQSSSAKSHQKKVPAGRPPHGRSLLNSKAKQKIKNTIAKPSNVKRTQKRSQLAEELVPELLEEPEDGPPPKWPQPGQGLYMKLVPEVEDRLILADENDEEAFSHFMVDKLGRQIIEPV